MIQTQNKAPSGVVLNGCASMSSNSPLGDDMVYNTLASIKLIGMTPYGQTSGAPDACYMQINPQLDGKACYFAFITDVTVNAANYGFWLRGYADGNQMKGLHGYWIGNVTRVAPAPGSTLGDALLFLQGCIENEIIGVFNHYSPNTPAIRIEDFDNTGVTGGSYHRVAYNQVVAFGSEQSGGTSPPTYGLVANGNCSGFDNIITLADNTASGNDVSASFYASNIVTLTSSGLHIYDAQVTDTLTIGNPAGGTFNGTLANGSPTISNITPPAVLTEQTDLAVGSYLSGTGIPAGAKVASIGATTITMSANATSTVSSAEAISYASEPGTLLVGSGKNMQFFTPTIASGSAVDIIPAGNITVDSAVMVLVAISNVDVNGAASRTYLVLINPRNNLFSSSTVTKVSSAYTSSGANEEPNAVTYALNFTAGAALPALTVNVTPNSGSHTYNATCQFVSTG